MTALLRVFDAHVKRTRALYQRRGHVVTHAFGKFRSRWNLTTTEIQIFFHSSVSQFRKLFLKSWQELREMPLFSPAFLPDFNSVKAARPYCHNT